MKQFFKNNILYFIHFIISSILELSTVIILTNSFMIREPWLLLSISIGIFAIYNLILNKKIKNGLLIFTFIIQIVLNIFCVILFENTGTLFDFSMFQLATESTTFLNTITINYWYIIYVLLLVTVYLLSFYLLSKYVNYNQKLSYQKLFCSILLGCTIISQGTIIYLTNRISEETFINSIYKDTNDKYANYGGSGNFLNEIAKMFFFNNYNQISNEEIDKFIYKETNDPTNQFGKSEGNNLVTILVESFEWFGFIVNNEIYPNGLNLTEDQLDKLFPNLRLFYNSSLVMNNHYAQNKTDISEDESLLGSYPSSAYISYEFPTTTLPTSTINNLKVSDPNIVTNFFHANVGSYYNRELVAKSLGFDNLYFSDSMEEKGLTNYINSTKAGYENCMNLDSEMFEVMKDEMFLTNKRFATHITTISMHGNYVSRPNMKKWIDKINSLNITIDNEYLKNYIAAVMDFDKAIGIMMEDLKNKNLLENTTIIMYADHNTYLSNLTYETKNLTINNYDRENYLELYRLPLMIYDKNYSHDIINKFTTTYDIVPTILDLFGINYYTNLYYGNSIFSEEESVLYSKAFDIFIADGLFYSNINNILFKKEDYSSQYIKEIEEKSKILLKKIFYTNNMFQKDYFKISNNYDKYITQMISINNN